MHKIIVRKVRGGFVARVKGEERLKRTGKTRGDAVTSLVLSNRKRFQIEVGWERSDKWTSNYLKGVHNVTPRPAFKIRTSKLPPAVSSVDAQKLGVFEVVKTLGCPTPFVRTLAQLCHRGNFGTGSRDAFSLGHICAHTESQIRSWANGHGYLRLGPTHMGWLKEILHHYGLSFKPKPSPEASNED